MNLVALAGNLGKEPKVTQTESGFTIAEFSIATQDTKKVDGKYEKVSDWHMVKCLGKTAELVDKYLDKGSKVGVQGRLKTDSWEKDGEKKYKTYVLCDKLEFLSSKGDNESKAKEYPEIDLGNVPF